jgi:hypothetical protein
MSFPMTPTTITSRTGADGVLSVVVSLGPDVANCDVRVTVEPIRKKPPMTEEQWAEWRAWVRRMAGSIDDPSFLRHEQGELQERDQL